MTNPHGTRPFETPSDVPIESPLRAKMWRRWLQRNPAVRDYPICIQNLDSAA